MATALKDGCDLVSFSGDKLLGGPQAGLVVGAQALIEKLRRDMLTRCLRLDKTMLAGLEATLRLHALGEDAACQRIPVLRMLALTADELKKLNVENVIADVHTVSGSFNALVKALH
ncbi:MAG: hypothetical protein COB95_06215 [Nitrosopumilales archaeon]|nr:MAG: hypothetical protein COB95_06215 [Nitrosopumilales archaeon]